MKNIKVVFLVGLPGSGKTTLLSKINDGFIIDDFSLNQNKISNFKISNEYILYIADPMLCLVSKEKAENALKKVLKDFKIEKTEWIFFENDLRKCWINVENRKDNRSINISFMKHLSKKYEENYKSELENSIKIYEKDK